MSDFKIFIFQSIFGLVFLYVGYNIGSLSVTKEWQETQIASYQIITKLKEELKTKEDEYYAESAKINSELNLLREKYNSSMSSIKSTYEHKLQQSNNRASVYRNLSEASEAERKRLAEYATRLDASLTEGIHLVKELRRTIELRDSQIKELGNQLLLDRKLVGQQ